jgi:phosphate transport system substrate-binding protein
MKKLLSFVVLVLFVSALGFSENIRIGGPSYAIETVLKHVKKDFEANSGIRVDLSVFPVEGIFANIDEGKVDVAMLGGNNYKELIAKMNKTGVAVDEKAYQAVELGKLVVKVILNKSNKVSKLSTEQLKGIFTGKITNWRQVGGANLPIIVVWGTQMEGSNNIFKKFVLKGAPVLSDVIEETTGSSARQMVANTEEAIAICPLLLIDDSIKTPDVLFMASPITMLVKGEPSAIVQKFIDFSSKVFGGSQ